MGSISGSGRSPGGEHGNPLQYSCLETPHGQGSLEGYSPQDHKNSDMVECVHVACTHTHTQDTQFRSVKSLSCVRLFATPWTAAHRLLEPCKLVSIESVMPSNRLILCHPVLLSPIIFPSIKVFSNESVLRIRWPKDWSFSFSTSPSNEYSGLISFRMDWLDLLAVQGTLQSLLQHHSSKASILQHSVFFTVQLSHLYMTTGKNHSLD